jgi:hypothetical protein
MTFLAPSLLERQDETKFRAAPPDKWHSSGHRQYPAMARKGTYVFTVRVKRKGHSARTPKARRRFSALAGVILRQSAGLRPPSRASLGVVSYYFWK